MSEYESGIKHFYANSESKPVPTGGEGKVEAGIMSANVRSDDIEFNYKALAVGAEGGVTPAQIGGELKASIAEGTTKIGPISGTLGLNANTGASIGIQKTGAKVLGTGGYIGKDGLELSLFGSGFKIKF